jgi:hypothetical protein
MSSDIDKANEEFCEHCSKLSDDHRRFPFPDVKWEYLHHKFNTDTMIPRLREQLQREYSPDLQQSHKEVIEKTKLKVFQDASDMRAEENKYSIDYEPQSIFELDAFHLLLTHEARLQKIYSWNTWGSLRMDSKSKLLAGISLEYLLSSIDHIVTKADVLYFIK